MVEVTDMDNDDILVGKLLSRREVLGLMSIAGAALIVGCTSDGAKTPAATATGGSGPATTVATEAATIASGSTPTGTLPSCVVRPALTEGPYFVDEKLSRSDIRSDSKTGVASEGAALKLTFMVSKVGSSCEPLIGAIVDVWHCDATGAYSDVNDPGFDTSGKDFLRGQQTTDASGKTAFTTIYPGWYRGRTVHIHFKIRNNDGGSNYEFTSQLFFDDAFTDEVYKAEPYASAGARSPRNAGDGIFQQNGDQLTLTTAKNGAGYTATFEIGLQI